MSCQKYYCQKYYGDLNLYYNSKQTNGKRKNIENNGGAQAFRVMVYSKDALYSALCTD